MKIALSSPYTDFYDHAFCEATEADVVWERNNHQQSRSAVLDFLARDCKFLTPTHGLVREIAPNIIEAIRREFPEEKDIIEVVTDIKAGLANIQRDSERTASKVDLAVLELQRELVQEASLLVVYTDEGKKRMSAQEALSQYPEAYCTQFIKTTNDINQGFSIRVITVGKTTFIVEYHNANDWDAHHGSDIAKAVVNKVEGILPAFKPPVPIFAIDLLAFDGKYLAVNFHANPSLADVEKYISSSVIYEAVEEFLQESK